MGEKKMGAPLRQQRDTRCHYPNDTTIVPRIRCKRKPSLGRRLYRLAVGCAGGAGIIGGYIRLGMRWIIKASIKAAMLALPFGWFLLAGMVATDGGILEFLAVLLALGGVLWLENRLAATLYPLLTEKERMELNGTLHM